MFIVCISLCSSVRDGFIQEAFTLKWLGYSRSVNITSNLVGRKRKSFCSLPQKVKHKYEVFCQCVRLAKGP